MEPFQKSHKLDHVLYDIRGAALEKAKKMEEEGYRILKLNVQRYLADNPAGAEQPPEAFTYVLET